MQVKSPTHYFGSFLIQTNSRGIYITQYSVLHSNTFTQGRFKIGRAVKHFIDQIQDDRMPPSILEKAGFMYGATKLNLGQSEVPAQR